MERRFHVAARRQSERSLDEPQQRSTWWERVRHGDVGRSVTGGRARASSRDEPTPPNFVSLAREPHRPWACSIVLTPQTSKVNFCGDADQSALASSLAASRAPCASRARLISCRIRSSQPRGVTRLRAPSCPARDSQNVLSLAIVVARAVEIAHRAASSLPKSLQVRLMRQQKVDRFREIDHGGAIRIDRKRVASPV